MIKKLLTHNDIAELASRAAERLLHIAQQSGKPYLRVYPIPRGGVPAFYMTMTCEACPGVVPVDNPKHADVFFDDIQDSGETRKRYAELYPGIPFIVLFSKVSTNDWIVFPWETGDTEGTGIEDNIRRILQFIGEDPTRQGLLETPARVAKAYAEWFDGYQADIPALFKTFTDGAEDCDEMVIIENIPVESFCEHHMARFHGVAHVGYVPDGKIIGLSKIPKLVRAFSHRLQVQERLTNQVADSLQENLTPRGVAVVLRCEHTCMSSRGARVHGTVTTTSAMRGVFRDDLAARSEFLNLVKM